MYKRQHQPRAISDQRGGAIDRGKRRQPGDCDLRRRQFTHGSHDSSFPVGAGRAPGLPLRFVHFFAVTWARPNAAPEAHRHRGKLPILNLNAAHKPARRPVREAIFRVADNSGIGGIRAASTRCPSLPFNTLSSPIDIHPRIARRRVARVPQAGCVAFLLSSTPLARLSSSGGVDQLWRGALSVPEVRTGRRCRLLHANGA